MIIFDIENITKGIGVVTASLAMLGGGYTLWDKLENKDILTWAPEYFEISDGPVDGIFDVIVAREKHRDDCSVEGFTLEIKDSKFMVHGATSGKFGFTFTIDGDHRSMISPGTATLLARINYNCPEGPVIVSYPDHENLEFNIKE
jgi:hypothetical protein